jgi:hypothetical protein
MRSEESEPAQRSRQGQQRVTKHPLKSLPPGPDEILFRRKDAPERYAEHDIYFSHERDLPRAGRGVLPDSDLLKAIHAYASHYYGALATRHGDTGGRRYSDASSSAGELPGGGGGRLDLDLNERSMDETALLAFGILLEEAGRETLGRRGDLVFTEPASCMEASSGGDGDCRTDDGDGMITSRRRVVAGAHEVGPRITPERKRRRLMSGLENVSSPR